MDPLAVRKALSNAEISLLMEDLNGVEDRAREVADLICIPHEDSTGRWLEPRDVTAALAVCNIVCDCLASNVGLLEQTMFTLVPPLCQMTLWLNEFIPGDHVNFVRVLRLISTSCNAREAVLLSTQVIKVLESTPTRWTNLHTAVLLSLPVALSRVTRKPLATLEDILQASATLAPKLLASFQEDEVIGAAPGDVRQAHVESDGSTAAHRCEAVGALADLWQEIAAALRVWPTEEREAGLVMIQMHHLLLLDERTLREPLAYDRSDRDRLPAPLPAMLGCLDSTSAPERRKHVARFVICMTSSLLSNGFNLWHEFGPVEEKFQGQVERGRALAAHCWLCARDFETQTPAGELSGTAFLESASQLACVLLDAAEAFQNAAPAVKGMALAAAASSRLQKQGNLAELTPSTQLLCERLVFLMAHHPNAQMRTLTFQILKYFLYALQVDDHVGRLEKITLPRDNPNLRSMAFQMVQQTLNTEWEVPGGSNPLLQAVRGHCNKLIMHWIAPEDLVWTADDIATVAEPIYSALNLLRLLILREGPGTPGFAATFLRVENGDALLVETLGHLEDISQAYLSSVDNSSEDDQTTVAATMPAQRLLMMVQEVREILLKLSNKD